MILADNYHAGILLFCQARGDWSHAAGQLFSLSTGIHGAISECHLPAPFALL